jgi:hypothetical protein
MCKNKRALQCVNRCCKACCVSQQCLVHFGCLLQRKNCSSLKDSDCTQGACRNCCTDQRCVHALCVFGDCRNKHNSRCEEWMCAKCCDNVFCTAHGSPHLCRRCQRVNFTAGCSREYCQACCKGSKRRECPTHKQICRDCGNLVRDLDVGCAFGCCVSCCKGRIDEPSDCSLHSTRWFGSFVCDCGNKWNSAYAYKGWKQDCRSCQKKVYGKYFVAHSGSGADLKKPHDAAGCEMCRSGRLCRPRGG